jgi:hypothetical protein
MQFVRMPKPIDIAESILPEQVADRESTYHVESVDTSILQQI